MLTHELRTPISAILGYAQLLEDGIPEPVPSKAREQVRRIASCATHLTGIVDQVMAWARLERGDDAEVRRTSVDVTELVAEVASTVRPLADRKGVSLRTCVDDTPATLETDAGRLRQILLNLLGNAVKFTDEGEVALVVHHSAGQLLFHVRDRGPGLEPEEHERIFEPFVQGSASVERTPVGTGLGLSISRMFARSLGGDVVVSSGPGRGSTFTLRLPTA